MSGNQKMWSLIVHLSMHFSYKYCDTKMAVDQEMWDWILENAAKSGFNTIVIDVLDAVQYGSHPELAMPGAWSRTKLRNELQHCRELGLTPIPKLNFSANHSNWLGPYKRMIATDQYYRLVDDLIRELYELFDHPEYFHIGMDEEDEEHARYNREGYCMFRRGDLYWHDMRYIIDSVKQTGAKPWMWYDSFINHHEQYAEKIGMDEVLLSPWYYHQLKEENFVPISEFQYDLTPYAGITLNYIEDIPRLASFRKNILRWAEEGYKMVPCAWSFKPGNIAAQMEYFHNGAPDESFCGMIVANWRPCLLEHKELFESGFRQFAEAKEKFYPES